MPMYEESVEPRLVRREGAEVQREPTAAAVAELLRKAAYRVGQPGAWTQHCLGRTEDGRGTFARQTLHERSIRSRCLLGALYCEHDLDPRANIHAAYEAVVRAIGTSLIADWNDHPTRTQNEVVGALLQASELATVEATVPAMAEAA